MKPKIGLSLMPTEDFWQASAPLFECGMVDTIEWSFDLPWYGTVVPDWCHKLLDKYSNLGQLLGHGVTGSLLSARTTDRQKQWNEMLKRQCRKLSYLQISEHFGFTEAGPFIDNAPLPVPLTNGFLKVGKQRLRQFVDATQLPIGIENLAFAFCLQDVQSQGEFIAELLFSVDGFLVLDLHNIYCQSENFNLAAEDILLSYPLERVTEIHVSGGSWSTSTTGMRTRIRRDTHDDLVPAEVFRLLLTALNKCPNVQFIILERIGGSMSRAEEQADFRCDYQKLFDLVPDQSEAATLCASPRHVNMLEDNHWD